MGACTVRVKVDRPFAGVTEFFSTGGHAVFTSDSAWLVMWDRLVVLAVNLPTGRVQHFVPSPETTVWPLPRTRKRLITSVEVSGTAVTVSFETAFRDSQGHQALDLNDLALWKSGLGPVHAGVFPSAFEPDVRAIQQQR